MGYIKLQISKETTQHSSQLLTRRFSSYFPFTLLLYPAYFYKFLLKVFSFHLSPVHPPGFPLIRDFHAIFNITRMLSNVMCSISKKILLMLSSDINIWESKSGNNYINTQQRCEGGYSCQLYQIM